MPYGDVHDWSGQLRRRHLTAADVTKWDAAFPNVWSYERARGNYIPPEDVIGSRISWPRMPYLCKPCGCYLCGQDFETKNALLDHWVEAHVRNQEDISCARVEEEIRKRLFWHEAMDGPFEICGQEHRRIVGAYAQHQTHSMPGSGCLNYTKSFDSVGRQLSGCAICARNLWLEDLYDMDLFTRPATGETEAKADSALDGGDNGAGDDAEIALEAPSAPARRARFIVHPSCAAKVNTLLSAESYGKRWPRIPKHELVASSVQHPHVQEWRWLLHTRRIDDIVLDESGQATMVKVCEDCGKELSRERSTALLMPKFALANDNWMGRVPFDFTPGGEPLREMEIKSLARARMCVQKVIAEPEKQGPRSGRQGGLRGNSIAFPQAKVEVCRAEELPPPREEAIRFMSETIVIAMAGVDVEDLHRAKWAQIRRTPYIKASEFLTSHNKHYVDVKINYPRAKETFAEAGETSEAVLLQAVPITVSENLKCRMEGPAEAVDGICNHEQVVAIDDEAVVSESDNEVDLNAAIPDPDHPEEAFPPLHVCADGLASSDVDEIQAIRKLYAEWEHLQALVCVVLMKKDFISVYVCLPCRNNVSKYSSLSLMRQTFFCILWF